MDKIEVQILNPEVLENCERMTACAARLTQRGHKISNMQDFMDLYNKEYTPTLIEQMCKLPHPTIQKFGVINIAVVGASRRFLAQITRHQNEVKFMSASLQYSNYSGSADFVVPYDVIQAGKQDEYIEACKKGMEAYEAFTAAGVDHDAAGYMAPQGLRNVLIISATPYQLKHMISQRTCNRNTKETQYVMLRIWEELMKVSPSLFKNAGPFCMQGACKEGKMSCGEVMHGEPQEILDDKFDLIR